MQKLYIKNYQKIGILGGTFDPPHKGHLHISKIALKKIKLDIVIWLVTKQNPFKVKPNLNIKTRIKLSKKVAVICDSKSYTYANLWINVKKVACWLDENLSRWATIGILLDNS